MRLTKWCLYVSLSLPVGIGSVAADSCEDDITANPHSNRCNYAALCTYEALEATPSRSSCSLSPETFTFKPPCTPPVGIARAAASPYGDGVTALLRGSAPISPKAFIGYRSSSFREWRPRAHPEMRARLAHTVIADASLCTEACATGYTATPRQPPFESEPASQQTLTAAYVITPFCTHTRHWGQH